MQRELARCLFRFPNSPARLWNAPRRRGIADGFWRSSKGSSGYSTEAIAKPERMRVQHRKIITLDPMKVPFSGQKTHDISNSPRPVFNLMLFNPPRPVMMAYKFTSKPIPFPPGSVGAFYYHPPAAGAPVLSGELRFKLCTDLAFFATSPDLQLPNQTNPWSLKLYKMLKTPVWKPLGQVLVREGLVSPDVVEAVERLPRVSQQTNSRILYSLEQPFELDLALRRATFVLLNLELAASVDVDQLYKHSRLGRPTFTGRIKARFELSTLPEHAAQGPTLVLRVLELLTPIVCHIPGVMSDPRPGELLYKYDGDKRRYYAWSFGLEKRALAPAFREFIGLPPLPANTPLLPFRGYYEQVVLTLCPEEMQSKRQGILYISDRFAVYLRVRLQDGKEEKVYTSYEYTSTGQKQFPPNSKGVLYYHRPSAMQPDLGGELRFRLCEDVRDFQKGSDLLAPNGGGAWSIPLYHLVKAPRLAPFLKLALQDKLVKKDVMDKIANLPYGVKGYRPLFAHDWPFVVDLSSPRIRFWLINSSMLEFVDIGMFRVDGGKVAPYAGLVKARFELSTLPEHVGSPVLVLRILELIEPVRHLIPDAEDRMPAPQAGSLFHKLRPGGKPKLWTYSLDQRAGGDAFMRFIASCEKA